MKNLLLILSAYLLFLFYFFALREVYAVGPIIFEDSFDNGMDFWDIISGNWVIKEVNGNNMLGTEVSRRNTVVEILARNSWSDNYVFDLDMVGIKGADKNLIFRIKDNGNRYGIHIDSDKNIVCIEKWINSQGWDNCKSWTFSNNIFYRLKIIVIENRILFYVDENLAIDFIDINSPIYTGGVGLKVSTGANYPSEVYFDNVRVTKINTPIVLIPGHGASFNFKEMFLGQSDPEGWQMTPGVNVYDNIIASLEANGYEKGRDLFIFNYNWLNSISDSADRYYSFVEDIINSSHFSSVKVVGHSMGGLVARTCFEKEENGCFINQLITVGSPHRGVLESYGAWEGGEIWRDGLTKLAFELFLNVNRRPLETNKETLRRLSPALAEMLPDFIYLKDVQGKELDFNSDNYPQRFMLNNPDGLMLIKDKTDFIFGKDYSTLRWLIVDRNLPWFDRVLGNWDFGKPVNKEFSNDGDGTVLELSAYPDEELSGHSFNVDHREIIADPVSVAKIMLLLDLEPQAGLEFLANEENFLVFYLQSPAHLEVNNQSQDILFAGDDNGAKLIIIANPDLDENYLVDVVGDDVGRYRLTVGKVYHSGSSWRNYDALIRPGQTDTFKINMVESTETETTESLQPIEELFQDLKSFDNPTLEPKITLWQELFNVDYQQALIYGYRLRSWLSLLAKISSEEIDLLAGLDKTDSIIGYLEDLVLRNQKEIRNEEYHGNFNFFSENINNFTPSLSVSGNLSRLAALDFVRSKQYFSQVLNEEEATYRGLVWSFSGMGLLKNSQILLQDN
ncbi:MAG: hypothetical protein PHX72_01030 [Candidatus Shapirobacteria bacterium]|nr:hypothetical protein [Candidatus Shapirobacteria bacterium]